MEKKKIKLLMVDYNGVMVFGSYKQTCEWIQKKYKKYDYKFLYDLMYHKYFCQAVRREISEKDSFDFVVRDLGLKENWKKLRSIHMSYMILNKRIFNLCVKMQKEGYTIVLLSKNLPTIINESARNLNIRKYFKNIINTYNLKLEKSSPEVLEYVLKKYKIMAEEAIMIDDQEFNLVSAKKMGIKTILYKDYSQFKKELDF